MTDHACTFPEVLIEEADEDDNLKAGMKVLMPCPICNATPLDHVEFMENRQMELQTALLAMVPHHRPMYHWAPSVRRKQIIRYGLRPSMRPTTTVGPDYPVPYVCLADSPSWAWALSGDSFRYAPGVEIPPWDQQWDLWQTWLHNIVEPIVHATPDRPSGLYEIRTEHRIYKRDIWYVGSRTK